jgi:hypothetical protein
MFPRFNKRFLSFNRELGIQNTETPGLKMRIICNTSLGEHDGFPPSGFPVLTDLKVEGRIS